MDDETQKITPAAEPQKNEPAIPAETIDAARRSPLLTSIYDFAEIMTSAVVVIVILFLFLFRFAGVVGWSMLPTLNNGDWLVISANLPHPSTGDIVIISQPNTYNEPLVKRVIASEGQEVDLRGGYVYVDGKRLSEPYLGGDVITEEPPEYLASTRYPVIVPPGHVYVLGDNRGGSSDSRRKEVGFIRSDYILGKVTLRLKPFGQFAVQ
ncbi:MAG: signal peptidase I [Oscillospiraceae bacterium]|jgi:signal peptidase I|nr:signal peptidase I [Oscillospiraceae bacterium]